MSRSSATGVTQREGGARRTGFRVRLTGSALVGFRNRKFVTTPAKVPITRRSRPTEEEEEEDGERARARAHTHIQEKKKKKTSLKLSNLLCLCHILLFLLLLHSPAKTIRRIIIFCNDIAPAAAFEVACSTIISQVR